MRVICAIQGACILMCGIVAAGCSQAPVVPSQFRAVAEASPLESSGDIDARFTAQSADLSPADLTARGWDCRPAPTIPNRVTCIHPNAVHPVLFPGPPPPPDRPAAITLLVFDSDSFTGTDILIRSDLYNGQTCASTGQAYRFIARIGYYECLHEEHGG